MIFWSGYGRPVRSGLVVTVIWVKRCYCAPCHRADALLPSFCLLRRLDAVEVIGPALVAVSTGAGTRTVAKGIGELFAYTTVRGWWRRHRDRLGWLAGVLAATFAVSGLDPLAAVQTAAAPVSEGLGVGPWPAVSLVLGGAWLLTNTESPTTYDLGRSLMALTAVEGARRPP